MIQKKSDSAPKLGAIYSDICQYTIYISYIEMNHDDYVCSKSKITLTIILTNDIMFLWKYII